MLYLNKRLSLCLALLMLAIPARSSQLVSLAARAKKSVVTVLAYNPSISMPVVGTGFLSGSSKVVTNAHCLAGAKSAEIRTVNGNSITVLGVVGISESADIAVLSLAQPVKGAPTLPLRRTVVREGERVFSIGTPLGLGWTVAEGTVSALREFPGVGPVLQNTCPMSTGSSGAPLIDMSGRVVGVVTAGLFSGSAYVSAGQNLNFAVGAEVIGRTKGCSIIPIAEIGKRLPHGWKSPVAAKADVISFRPYIREDHLHASELLRGVVRRSPRNAVAWLQLGYSYMRLSAHRKAADAFRTAAVIDPHLEAAQNNLGLELVRLGRSDEAICTLQKCLESSPHYVHALANLTYAYYAKGDFANVIRTGDACLKQDPRNADALCYQGLAFLSMGRSSEALETLIQATYYDTSRPELYVGLGMAYLAEAQLSRGLGVLRYASQLEPQYGGGVFSLGNAYVQAAFESQGTETRTRRLDQARIALEKARSLGVNSADLFCNLCTIYIEKAMSSVGKEKSGYLNQADAVLREAEKCQPDLNKTGRGVNLRALVLMNQGSSAAATQILEDGRKFFPDQPQLALLLGRLYVQAGRMDAARELAAAISDPMYAKQLQSEIPGVDQNKNGDGPPN